MPRAFRIKHHGGEPEPDPEPPMAPPVIILSQTGSARSCQQPRLHSPPPTSALRQPDLNHSNASRSKSSRYNLRPKPKPKHLQSDPDPDPPEPDPAPPIIILHKRPASASPPRTRTPTLTAPSQTPTTPLPQDQMGSKASKVSERAHDGKLQPSVAKSDKAEMKEPTNYYSHRSKSLRRKAGKGGAGVAGQGSGGGLS